MPKRESNEIPIPSPTLRSAEEGDIVVLGAER